MPKLRADPPFARGRSSRVSAGGEISQPTIGGDDGAVDDVSSLSRGQRRRRARRGADRQAKATPIRRPGDGAKAPGAVPKAGAKAPGAAPKAGGSVQASSPGAPQQTDRGRGRGGTRANRGGQRGVSRRRSPTHQARSRSPVSPARDRRGNGDGGALRRPGGEALRSRAPPPPTDRRSPSRSPIRPRDVQFRRQNDLAETQLFRRSRPANPAADGQRASPEVPRAAQQAPRGEAALRHAGASPVRREASPRSASPLRSRR